MLGTYRWLEFFHRDVITPLEWLEYRKKAWSEEKYKIDIDVIRLKSNCNNFKDFKLDTIENKLSYLYMHVETQYLLADLGVDEYKTIEIEEIFNKIISKYNK